MDTLRNMVDHALEEQGALPGGIAPERMIQYESRRSFEDPPMRISYNRPKRAGP